MAHGGSWKTKRIGAGVLQTPTFLTPKKVPRFAFPNSSFFLAIWSLWMKLKNESLYISSCRPSNNIKKEINVNVVKDTSLQLFLERAAKS